MEYRLDVYQVIDGTDDWPLVETITGNSEGGCLEEAERKYGSNEGYHWTNPY